MTLETDLIRSENNIWCVLVLDRCRRNVRFPRRHHLKTGKWPCAAVESAVYNMHRSTSGRLRRRDRRRVQWYGSACGQWTVTSRRSLRARDTTYVMRDGTRERTVIWVPSVGYHRPSLNYPNSSVRFRHLGFIYCAYPVRQTIDSSFVFVFPFESKCTLSYYNSYVHIFFVLSLVNPSTCFVWFLRVFA